MRQTNPAPYAAFLRCAEFALVSASPERPWGIPLAPNSGQLPDARRTLDI